MTAFSPNQEAAYQANSAKHGYPATPTRTCPSCRNRQSIYQFFDAGLAREFKKCKTCRKK